MSNFEDELLPLDVEHSGATELEALDESGLEASVSDELQGEGVLTGRVSGEGTVNPVAGIMGQAKQGASMLDQLLDDMEDEEFWSLPAGEWEAKNQRDGNGFPL